MSNWNDYLKRTKGRPRPLLCEALTYVSPGRNALDLGAGALNDTRLLLSKGFRVTVVDSNPQVAELAKTLEGGVEVHTSSFDTFEYPENAYDLVNAQYALPFNPPGSFNRVFSALHKSLKPKAIFAGQLFGLEDEWKKTHPEMSFHDENQVRSFFKDYDLKKLVEEKGKRPTAAGLDKYWHVFHLIAQKVR